MATAILVLNNLRDLESDAAAGKRTLATLIGRQPTRVLLVLLVAGAFTVPIVIFLTHLAHVTIMAMHFGIPIASVPVRTALATTEAVALVRALKRMAIAEMAYALLFTVGILL
jgi:1,4-dihydroxy-2-naphthoate octaprenyltransferase